MENQECPCPCKSCPRNENCEECQRYHHRNEEKTFCGK